MASQPSHKRLFSARRFAVGAMVCPACRRRLEEAADRCPSCGFTGTDCLIRFPFAAPALAEIIDPAGVLDAAGRREVSVRLARLRRRCRQLRWCLCLVDLPEGTDLRLFGFWLLNAAQAPANDPEAAAWTVLLLLDTRGEAAAVSTGYAVEPFIADDAWMRALNGMVTPWRSGDMLAALCSFLTDAGNELAVAAARAARLGSGGKGEES